MIGPTLLDFGSEAQKDEHLPKIVRGEIRWCQGYSEPGAGSDLASLSTRATRDGDDLVITGQKLWTSYADRSDWIFCLVRTDPNAKKQRGISFVLVDMETPGVSTRRIQLISGASPFCEVFLDAVRAPVSNVVSEINDGWSVAKALLGYERSMIGEAIGGQLADATSTLVTQAHKELGVQGTTLPDESLRHALAAYAMDELCYRHTVERARDSISAGAAPGAETSILKVCGSELKQRRFELALRIAGPQALGWDGHGFDAEELELTREWLRSRANTIEGGTTEIQLDIIAKRVLGLP
jgi:alkylation response protein AidB-like acyl-CoA dehydrogenase